MTLAKKRYGLFIGSIIEKYRHELRACRLIGMWSHSCLFSFGLASLSVRLSPGGVTRWWETTTPHSGVLATYLATPAQATSLSSSSSRSSRLDFLGPEFIRRAITVAKGMKDADWPELISVSPPEPEWGQGVEWGGSPKVKLLLPDARRILCWIGQTHSYRPHLSFSYKFISCSLFQESV